MRMSFTFVALLMRISFTTMRSKSSHVEAHRGDITSEGLMGTRETLEGEVTVVFKEEGGEMGVILADGSGERGTRVRGFEGEDLDRGEESKGPSLLTNSASVLKT